MVTALRERKIIIRHASGALNLIAADITKGLGERFEREDVYASCFTCTNCQDNSVEGDSGQRIYCKKYKQYPPLKIIVNSCIEGYRDNDDIPF